MSGQTWRQTGPGEKIDVPRDYDEVTFAAGPFMAGKMVITGDHSGMVLVDVPFAGEVYSITAYADPYGCGELSCWRYPAELLEAGLAIVDGATR